MPGALSNRNDDIAGFFSRPIKISNFSTLVPNLAISPLQIYLNNPQIYDKMNHYKYLRCTVKVRFVMTASPFVKGRLLIYYDPLPVPGFTRDSLTVFSNMPHIIMDPGLASDVVLTIPYHDKNPYYDISSLISGGTSGLGFLASMRMTPFQNISTGTPADINITVTAWLEDVELQVSSLTPNGKKGHGTMVSDVASTVVNIADKLSSLPLIGPLATATSIGASAIGGIASLFGFTKPIVLSEPIRNKQLALGNLAATNGGDVAIKLTTDPKCERIIGSGMIDGITDDEMVISNIASRFTYMDATNWSSSDAIGDQIDIFYVNPVAYNGIIDDEFQMSNIGFVTMPFSQWRGTIVYKFSLVKTVYHRGKLRLTWTPEPGVVATDDNLHLGYSVIWDIQDATEMTVEVPFNNRVVYLPVAPIIWGATDNVGSNGIFQISVIETLQSSIDSADIDIQVWVAAGDDYQVNVPTNRFIGNLVATKPLTTQKMVPIIVNPSWATLDVDGTKIPLVPDPEPNSNITIAPPTILDSADIQVVGESIISFRDLVHRYSLDKIITIEPLTAVFLNGSPYLPGAGKIGGTDYTNLEVQSVLTWLMPAYYAYRGSTRFKCLINSPLSNANLLVATRDFQNHYCVSTAPDEISHQKLIWGGAFQGSTAANHAVDGALEIEVPFYQRTLFTPTKLLTIPNTVNNGFWVGMQNHTAGRATMTVLRAAGDDVDLSWYIGPPTYFNYYVDT